jgi:hypothetical protein
MNRQEAFDTVVEHLFKQGRRSVNDKGFCSYRGNNGTMCAVGVLIPDELYNPAMDVDGQDIETVCKNFKVPAVVKNNLPLMGSLQSAHDGAIMYSGEDFDNYDLYERLLYVAQEYKLKQTKLNQYKPEGYTP